MRERYGEVDGASNKCCDKMCRDESDYKWMVVRGTLVLSTYLNKYYIFQIIKMIIN